MFKQTKGSPKINFSKVIARYNGSFHRGIGMSPDDAIKQENREKVLHNQEKYAVEFKKNNKILKLEVNDKVVIRNEVKANKMDKEFYEKCKIVKILENDTYMVLKNTDETVPRHWSQLKLYRECRICNILKLEESMIKVIGCN